MFALNKYFNINNFKIDENNIFNHLNENNVWNKLNGISMLDTLVRRAAVATAEVEELYAVKAVTDLMREGLESNPSLIRSVDMENGKLVIKMSKRLTIPHDITIAEHFEQCFQNGIYTPTFDREGSIFKGVPSDAGLAFVAPVDRVGADERRAAAVRAMTVAKQAAVTEMVAEARAAKAKAEKKAKKDAERKAAPAARAAWVAQAAATAQWGTAPAAVGRAASAAKEAVARAAGTVAEEDEDEGRDDDEDDDLEGSVKNISQLIKIIEVNQYIESNNIVRSPPAKNRAGGGGAGGSSLSNDPLTARWLNLFNQ